LSSVKKQGELSCPSGSLPPGPLFHCLCRAGEFLVQQAARQRTAVDDDAHTDQPGLDDQNGSEGTVGDGT
jgi:hypothetical protein